MACRLSEPEKRARSVPHPRRRDGKIPIKRQIWKNIAIRNNSYIFTAKMALHGNRAKSMRK